MAINEDPDYTFTDCCKLCGKLETVCEQCICYNCNYEEDNNDQRFNTKF